MRRYRKNKWRVLLAITLCVGLLLSNPNSMWQVNSYANLENTLTDDAYSTMLDSSFFIDQELAIVEETIKNQEAVLINDLKETEQQISESSGNVLLDNINKFEEAPQWQETITATEYMEQLFTEKALKETRLKEFRVTSRQKLQQVNADLENSFRYKCQRDTQYGINPKWNTMVLGEQQRRAARQRHNNKQPYPRSSKHNR